MMRAEAEPKPRRRRNESPRGAPVARSAVWVGPFNCERDVYLRSTQAWRLSLPPALLGLL